MDLIELAIIHGGCSLYTRKHADIKGIDEDVGSSAMYSMFVGLTSLLSTNVSENYLKLEVGRYFVHMERFVELVDGDPLEFIVQVILGTRMSKNRAIRFMNKVFSAFITIHGHDLSSHIQSHEEVTGFDETLDGLVKKEK